MDRPTLHSLSWRGLAVAVFVTALIGLGCQATPRTVGPAVDGPRIEVRDASMEAFEGWMQMTPRGVDDRPIWVAPDALLVNRDIALAERSTDVQGRRAVLLVLTDEGAEKMEALSRERIGRRLAMLVDDQLVAVPTVRSQLVRRVLIANPTESEAERIVRAFGGE